MGGVVLDWSVKLGDLLTLAGFLFGGVTFMISIRSDVAALKATEDRNAKKIEEFQSSLKTLSDATVTIARQDERMKGYERRLDDIGREIGDLKDDVRMLTHPGTP